MKKNRKFAFKNSVFLKIHCLYRKKILMNESIDITKKLVERQSNREFYGAILLVKGGKIINANEIN